MKIIQYKISEDSNLIMEPDLHDGTLLGINIEKIDEIDVIVEDIYKNRYKISFRGVTDFHATNIRTYNIIFDIFVTHGRIIYTDYQMDLFKEEGELDSSFECRKNAIISNIINKNMFAITISSSCGCSLACVSKEFFIQVY